MKIKWPILAIILIVIIFFYQIGKGLLPIPADTIIGLYHPFRDLYKAEYPNGIPFKNFLITDPVRQQYPWRGLSIDLFKNNELPLWNPYSMAGYPLMGNVQSGALYPLNILFFVLPFVWAWSALIILQPLLAGLFLYFYLRNLGLNALAALLGSIAFAFSGFFIAWLTWGTILHVGLWLPLILLSIDKIFKNKNILWSAVFIFSLVSSFFAGHLQTFFYVFVLSFVYLITRWYQFRMKLKALMLFVICYLLFVIVTAIQWIPTFQLIGESARDIDLNWQKEGWFIPVNHLIQFIAPDFFGNPTTLNYWGAWNYGEFIGYIGILPLIMALFALITRRDKKTLFFASLLLVSLILALSTFIAKIPYELNIPFLSTAQPTRLLFMTCFSLAILSALGFDLFLKSRKKILYPVGLVGIILISLWLFVWLGRTVVSVENLEVAKRNLILPTVLFGMSLIILSILQRFTKQKNITLILCCTLIVLTTFDLLRFGWKFTPFTNKEYLFPQTKVIEFLKKQEGQFRIMTTDNRILPPNFSTIYRIETIDGYDPLYLRRYGELIAASERGEPNISPPFGFNRIITPKNYESKIIDLLGVKYILSLTDLESPKLVKVFQEGETRVYENKTTLPRAFFVQEARFVGDKDEAIRTMFENGFDPMKTAVVEEYQGVVANTPWRCVRCNAKIIHYNENKVVIQTKNDMEGILLLTDSFYPTWKAKVDGVLTKIYRADYNFRGIVVSEGNHTVEFYVNLL